MEGRPRCGWARDLRQVRLGILDSARSATDYDRIAAVTGQPTEWIAPRGSL
jgi:hypothetical protein